jgi:hypothetical protein
MEEGRVYQRYSRLLRGALCDASGHRHDLLIKNVSRYGVGAKFSGPGVKIGDEVQVDIPHIGICHGTVRWMRNGNIGVQLLEAVDPEQLRFQNTELTARETESYHVADRFQPVISTYRPGLKRR